MDLPIKYEVLKTIKNSTLNVEYRVVKVDFTSNSMFCIEKYQNNELVELKKLL